MLTNHKRQVIRVIFTTFLIVISLVLSVEYASAAVSYTFPARNFEIHILDADQVSPFPKSVSLTGSLDSQEDNTTIASVAAPISGGSSNQFLIRIPQQTLTIPSGLTPNSGDLWTRERALNNLKIGTSQSIRHVKQFDVVPGTTYKSWSVSNIQDGNLPGPGNTYNRQLSSTGNDGAFLFKTTGNYELKKNTAKGAMHRLGWNFIEQRPSSKLWGIGMYALSGDVIPYYAVYREIKEVFENDTGILITPPTGFIQGKTTEINSDPFSYTMDNGGTLPQSYVSGGKIYTYKGWYKGAGNKTTMNTTYPPNVVFTPDYDETKDEVHIVYDEKVARTVVEQYVNDSLSFINSSWNTNQSVADGSTFTNTPDSLKTDASGADWEYKGWKLSTEPISALKTTPVSVLVSGGNRVIHYVYSKKQHNLTKKWVDADTPSSLLNITPNPDTSAIIEDNGGFTESPSPTITDNQGGNWNYVGWEDRTSAPGTVNATPVAIANIKGNKEILYHYRKANTTATLELTPSPQIVNNGDSVTWSAELTNTGSTALDNLTLKATGMWMSGLGTPTQITVAPASGGGQTYIISASDWTNGFNLSGISIPNGLNNTAMITFTTTVTGSVNQVIPAEIEMDGNISSPIKSDSFIRIDDPDEPNLKQTGDTVLMNIPDFRFGRVPVLAGPQTKSLDTSSYQVGYNPYIRFKDQSTSTNWDVYVKLGQFSEGSNTLPTSTNITLKNGMLKEVVNFNKVNETLTNVGPVSDQILYSDDASIRLASGTSHGVYQLDFPISDINLNLGSTSSVSVGPSYQAVLTWEMSTSP